MEVLLRIIAASTTSEMPLIVIEWLLLVHALERLLHLELRWLLPRLSILRHRAYRILSLKLSRLEWLRHLHCSTLISWIKGLTWLEIWHVSFQPRWSRLLSKRIVAFGLITWDWTSIEFRLSILCWWHHVRCRHVWLILRETSSLNYWRLHHYWWLRRIRSLHCLLSGLLGWWLLVVRSEQSVLPSCFPGQILKECRRHLAQITLMNSSVEALKFTGASDIRIDSCLLTVEFANYSLILRVNSTVLAFFVFIFAFFS